MKQLAIFIGIIFLSLQFALGQTPRYWSVNFNAEASLLAGSVVAGGGGVSSIYYNPATLTEVEEHLSSLPTTSSSVSISANLFTLDMYKVKNLFRSGTEISERILGVQPRFFSVTIRPDKARKISMEVAAFTRDQADFEIADGGQSIRDFYPEAPGDEVLSLLYDYQNTYNDKWYGLAAGYELLPGFSVGASLFGSFKSLTARLRINGNIYGQEDSMIVDGETLPTPKGSSGYYERVKYNDTQLIIKLGSFYKTDNWSVGLNITFPAISVINSAEVGRDFHQLNFPHLESEENDILPDIIISDFQNKLSARYKTPLSIAFGFNYSPPSDEFLITTTIEYFQGISPYKVIEGEINPNITTRGVFERMENKDWLSYAGGAREVWNFGIGYRHQISAKLIMLLGMRTDFSYLKGFSYEELSGYPPAGKLNYHVYHLSAGGRFNVFRHNVTFGLQYSRGGDRNIDPLFVPTEGESPNGNPGLFSSSGDNIEVVQNSLGMFFGITLNFGKDLN